MAMDETGDHEAPNLLPSESSSGASKIVAIFAILTALVIGEIYSFSEMNAMRRSFRVQEKETRTQLTADMSSKLLSVEQNNDEQLKAVKESLDAAGRRMGSQSRELHYARALVARLESQQAKQVNDLKHEISLKADQEQVTALNEDVSSTKSDLNTTQQNVSTLASDYGMTKSRFGTLIARNHKELEQLIKLGQRNYYEFTLIRNRPARVAAIGLTLKKTNVKHHRFNMNLLVDDMVIEKKNRTIDEPIFFLTRGSRSFDELVVNEVDKNKITGYISTPKVTTEMASRSEGAQ
jgi:hypothetical protein